MFRVKYGLPYNFAMLFNSQLGKLIALVDEDEDDDDDDDGDAPNLSMPAH